MRVDREGLLSEPAIEDHIGRLAPDTGQPHEILARVGHLAVVFVDEQLAQRDHVLRLGIEQADGLDMLLQAIFAQGQHLFRRFHLAKQSAGGLVDPHIRRLCGQGDRDDQLIGIAVFQFGFGRRIVFGKPAEELENLVLRH